MTAELSASKPGPSGVDGCGARMWDKPAAWTICRPLSEPRRQPSEASTHVTTAVITSAGPVFKST